MIKSYKLTRISCYTGYITQAIINNFAPLLFVFFRKDFGISVSQLGFLIAYNFTVQMIVDFLSAAFVDKIGIRKSIVIAHFFSSFGLILLGILPFVFNNSYWGLIVSVTFYAIGGGIIEVLISPIIDSLPSDNKSGGMSLLHSFYCWGHAGVVIISTLFFLAFGISNWRWLAFFWALIPLCNSLLFLNCPICPFVKDGQPISINKLLKMKIFWVLFVLMICSGASELAISQWVSYFAQSGLNISKTLGDLLGTLMFAVLMGTSRALFGKFSNKIVLEKSIIYSSLLCIIGYLTIIFSPLPMLSLVGCGICGFSVGIMWPGVFSMASQRCPSGGTAMFAFLALAGDIGCGAGPALIGQVSQMNNDNLKIGILSAIVFPVLLAFFVKLAGKVKSEC